MESFNSAAAILALPLSVVKCLYPAPNTKAEVDNEVPDGPIEQQSPIEPDDWVRYQAYVVNELQRLSTSLEDIYTMLGNLRETQAVTQHDSAEIRDLREQITQAREKIAALEVRCGLYGAVAGTVVFLVVQLWRHFT